MAIEDILQVKESVTDRKYNPEGDPQTVNQTEFLRFQEQMGLGPDGVMAKLIQMFVEEPSEFTRKFGVEAADSVREFLGNTTQKELESQGRVFAPDSAEIIGQNIDYTPDQSAIGTLQDYTPDQSAIGTLQTDQADESEQMMKFLQNQLGSTPQSATSVLRAAKEDFNPKDYREGYLMLMNNLYPDTDREVHAQEYDNWFRGGEGSEYYEDRKNRLLKLLSNMPGGGAGHESAEDFWKRAHPDQFDKEGNYIGKKEGEKKLRVITDEEAEELGFKTGDGRIYQIDEETGDVTLKKPGLIEGGILKLMDWFKYGHTEPENR